MVWMNFALLIVYFVFYLICAKTFMAWITEHRRVLCVLLVAIGFLMLVCIVFCAVWLLGG